MSDIRSYINPIKPRFGEAAQAEKLTGISYVENRSGKVIDKLIASIREGSIVEVVETFLLAPAKGSGKRRRKVLAKRFGEVKERGGLIWERSTDHRSNNRSQCAQMLLRAYEMISNSGRGAPGQGRTGRPGRYRDPETRKILTGMWCSRQYPTREASVAAMNDAGYRVTKAWCYNNLGKPETPKDTPTVPPAPKPKRGKACLVYFLRDGAMVKIGSSTTVRKRIESLNGAHHRKLELLATIPGGRKRELALHKKFKRYRVRGEWFHFAAPIIAYINRHKTK